MRKGGSSCCVLRAVYLEKEVAVKLIYNSRDGYADACHEACIYQVGVDKGGEDVMAPIRDGCGDKGGEACIDQVVAPS